MKSGIGIGLIMLLTACSSGFDPDFSAGLDAGIKALSVTNKPPKSEFNDIVDQLVGEMLSNNLFVTKQNAIAVASVVQLDDLTTTNRIGNQFAEGIVHSLHDNGYRVVDYKLTGSIMVTPEGDLTHSRDWEKLKGEFSIDYLVSGTMDSTEEGILVHVRMVGLQSQVVVGSGQAFIAKEIVRQFSVASDPLYGEGNMDAGADKYMREGIDSQRRVKLDNGMLIRRQR